MISPEYPGAIPIFPEPPSAIYVLRKKLSPPNFLLIPAKNHPFIAVLGFIVVSIQAIEPGSTITDSPSFKLSSTSEYEGAETMLYFISPPSEAIMAPVLHLNGLDHGIELRLFLAH